jgi:DNA-binding transcriptional ArsR family regulator
LTSRSIPANIVHGRHTFERDALSDEIKLRYRITRAVRKSDLPSPSRLIMLVLADVADTGTAEIPPQRTPSVAVLSTETGLDRRTIQRHLDALDEAGWLSRVRPSEREQWFGHRVRYRLLLPAWAVVAEDPEEVAQDHGVVAQDRTGAAEDRQDGGTEPPLSRSTDLTDTDQIKMPFRPDVERICEHLAECIVANGSNPPNITKKWRTAARLLLDKDGRTEEQVVRAIDWSQGNTFWRANILSMPKLREKYEQLRLQAQAQREKANGTAQNGHKPYQNSTDPSAYEGDL